MSPRKPINGPSATRVASTPVPKITKGKRSTRRRRIYQNVHNDDLSAMHVLADIAGEILEEDSLMNENPKPELIKPELLDQDTCRRTNSRVSKKVDSKKVSPGKSTDGENKRAFCDSKLVYTRQRTQFKKEAKKENVKLSIKSVKIPELVLEVSETSTIASLKKRVLEAMIGMLGKELDVGVTLQGTKFQDENLNLAQVEKLNDLDFSLEHKSKSSRDNSHVTVEKPISVPLPTPNPNPLRISNLNPLRQQSPICANLSKAIVVNQMQAEEPLAVIPSARKSKQVEPVVQRRIRRPFSVGEVEALVRAVEKLGTGRWRDVKIRAFDDAEHRTYVDLKDKWKTLVHTASIAPQQRRGEPVPQDLLDRVLAAQSYWNQQKGSETCPLAQN